MPLLALLPGHFRRPGDWAVAVGGTIAATLLAWARLQRTVAFWPGRPVVARWLIGAGGFTLLLAAIFASPWAQPCPCC